MSTLFQCVSIAFFFSAMLRNDFPNFFRQDVSRTEDLLFAIFFMVTACYWELDRDNPLKNITAVVLPVRPDLRTMQDKD